MLGTTCESGGASRKLGITKKLIFPREGCGFLSALLGFQGFSRYWSWVLGLLGAFGSSWTCVGASQGPVTVLESCVHWDLFLASLLKS